ncbi:MAG: hypothetical protein L3J82_04305, partial [Planctomycetes bacterium]|nr:hypothetical protein [Planctomycetota bacterium]
MSQIEYFKIPKGFSRWIDGLDWSETCDAVVVTGGPTLALGTALAQFIEGAFRNTQPIHFAYVLHFLASAKYEDDQWRRLHDLGFAVNRNSGALFAALTRQVPRLDLDFDMAETRHLLLQHTELVSVHWLETSSADIAVDAASFDLGVAQAVQSLSDDDIKHWLRHGRGPLPETKDPPELPKREQTFTELVEKLLKSPRLAGVSDLMQQVIAAVSIPPRSQQRTELPIGGYSSIVNRGQPDQILMSEHAVDELEFLRRYANNELLYWQREEPQNQQAEELCIVLDQGVRTWGEPRLALTAAALALGKQAEKAEMPCKFVFSGEVMLDRQPASLQFESSDLTSNPAQALRQALADARPAKDIILLTHPRNLAELEVLQAASEQTENQRLFAITVDEKGIGTLQQLTTAGQVKLRTFELNIQPPITERPEPELEPKADKQWTGDIDPIPMPFNLGISGVPRAFAMADNGRCLVAITESCGIQIWKIDSDSHATILPSHKHWKESYAVNLTEIPNGLFIRLNCTSDDCGETIVCLSLDFTSQKVTLGPSYTGCAADRLLYCNKTDSLVSLFSRTTVFKRKNMSWIRSETTEDKSNSLPTYGQFFALPLENPHFAIAIENGMVAENFVFEPKTGKCGVGIDEHDFYSEAYVDGKSAFRLIDTNTEGTETYCIKTRSLVVICGQSTADQHASHALVFSSNGLRFLGHFKSFQNNVNNAVAASANRLVYWSDKNHLCVREFGTETEVVFQTHTKKIHSSLTAELGHNWL